MKSVASILFVGLLAVGLQLRAQTTYTGTGIKLALKTDDAGRPLIEYVIPHSPAAKANLLAGEPVWEVDGKPTSGADFWAVVRSLEGEPGVLHRIVVGKDRRSVTLTVSEVRGQCLSGDCAEGEGLFRDLNDDLYAGHFRAGRYHGAGRLEMGTNSVYDGEFADGLYHGKGTLREDGKLFSGNWAQGREADGPGFLILANGDRIEGEGQWINGFTGPGIFTDAARRLRVEGMFDHAHNLTGLDGKASVRALATDHVYVGVFYHGQLVKRGEIETKSGARLPAQFEDFDKLLAALNQPTLTGADTDPGSRRTFTIEVVPDEPPARSAARPTTRPKAETAPPLTACAACGGTGFVVKRCGWCQGKGLITHAYKLSRTKTTSYAARSVYDSAGRLIGQSSGYDVTSEPYVKSWEEKCHTCEGRGALVSNTRCPVCAGAGGVPAK